MQPLKGLTVVALEHAIAAPFANRQPAGLGARAFKIECPVGGDFARGCPRRGPVRALGEPTDASLAGLGFAADAIRALRAERAL